jgi:electron transfer flavoprotein alpha subunit
VTAAAPLVFLEERDGEIVPGSLGLLAKARALGGAPVALLCGSGVRALADGLGRLGAARVLVADDPALAAPLAAPRVDLVASLVRELGFDLVLFEGSALTADVAAGLAARLEAGVNWDLADLRTGDDGELIGERLALGDTALVEVGWTHTPRIAVLRRGLLEPTEVAHAGADGAPAPVEELEVAVDEAARRVRVVERTAETEAEASIERAAIVVAGGRGLGRREDLALLEELADALGGAVGVTMPLVDRGWYPYAHQVGQTGHTVRPDLYLACGISGAVQHRVGMEKSGTIVAINTDRTAPIFRHCDVGVVGDALEIVPRLTELVRARRG